MSNTNRIIDIAEARIEDFSHEALAEKLMAEHGYTKDQMEYEHPGAQLCTRDDQ